MSAPFSILIVSGRPDRADAWAAALASWAEVRRPDDGPAEGWLPEVILTDGPRERARLAATLPAAHDADIGVVALGGTGDRLAELEVSLSPDAAVREVVLACRLLAEIVRLRRQREEGLLAARSLGRLAYTDPLTDLANRRAWDEQLDAAAGRSAAGGEALCVAIIDLDHFKRVNDAHGLARGDDVLKAAARQLAAGVRRQDFVARLGGDEFGLLLAGLSADAAHAVVDRIRSSMAAAAGAPLPMPAASAGFAMAEAGRPIERGALFAAADAALRRAKAGGRDRTVAAPPDSRHASS